MAGTALTGQLPYESAAVVALGAVPGAHLGAVVSRRLSAGQLKAALGVTIAGIGLRVWWDVLSR